MAGRAGSDGSGSAGALSFAGLVVALVAAMGLFWLLTEALSVGEGIAALPASAILASSGAIGSVLQRRSLKGLSTRDFLAIPHDVVSPAGFEVSFLHAIAIGVGVYEGAAFAAGFVAGSVGSSIIGLDQGSSFVFALGAGLAITLVVSVAIGYWIGTRRWRHGLVLAALTVALARLIDVAIGAYVVPLLLDPSSVEPGRVHLLDVLLDPAALTVSAAVVVAAVLGWQRGHAYRAGAYLAFLARLLTDESRTALVDLAYQEAMKDRERVRRPAGGA
jgi:hypothetical protein